MNEYLEIARKISSRHNTLSPESLQKLAELLTPVRLKKGEMLLNQGEILRYLVYVDSGLLRQFYYKKGKDVTEHFGCEGTLVMCIHSLFGEQPTELMIEAIEPTLVYNIDYKGLIGLMNNSDIALMYRLMLENGLKESQNKADSWRFETARERYDRFIRDYPQAARLASINDIASYLLMAPESLSRVRSGTL
ncbi:Crp/Fnr family transcriptional regulator [Parabacteroides sp. PF5-9]|uniref:Crp/Fnr family transcriptional regulator n=1 Tax=Parabacteroides sp. PF5-9 TaxID=1742404 RepID=UPI002475B74B|nr:Crp/Fnr family transcriptional regulator [Parabacteroides sp. PF5-9]MDH6359092.1 CRP-like cAMP-binding protein [Parabacteroides sp. PF5-9]